MPRPRSQRTPPAAAAAGAAAEEPFGDAPPPPAHEEQVLARRVRDPAEEQVLRGLPNTLSREMKMAALGWRGGCFCCPANISFAQCISGLWQAARKPADSADALVHWGLNASKFLFEAGPNGFYGRNLLLRAGFSSLVPQLLSFSEEVAQSVALTPQVFFVQVFATGGRQLPLSTTPQLAMLGLLALATLSPASLRDTLAGAGPELLAALLRALESSTDDRLRALTFQTLTEWMNIFGGEPLVDDEEGEEREGGGAPGELDALIDGLFDAGLAPAVVHVLQSSSNAAALRDACAFLLALLAGGVGAGGRAAGGGHGPGGGHGAQQGAPTRVAGLTAMELAADAALEGRARCRARTELLKAGLVPALLSVLSRRPSQLRYWVAINLGVSGARHLEMQWLALLIARLSVLPPRPPLVVGEANGAAEPAAAKDAAGTAAASPSGGAAEAGKGRQPQRGSGGRQQRGRGRGQHADSEEEAERLRLEAAEQLLQSPLFSPWLRASGSPAAAAPATMTETAAAAEAATTSSAAAPEAGKEEAGASGVADGATVVGEEEAEAGERAEETATATGAGGEAAPPAPSAAAAALSLDVRAVKLLSRVIAGSTLRSCVLPEGAPLEALPPRERNATPDFRSLQRDRIRRAADEARAAQALASATSAVDVLSQAVAAL
ncbi:hypothetical protein PLESTF_000126900 [Pleodorina starrii]|nr:hypothetical protein PLESTM_000172900 [Pleodorina starrii]GLC64123.1 hypothetical protein PLESTF_000126900 [Pleodorina starrii]